MDWAGLIVEIPEDVSIANSLPKIKVIDGNKIIDFGQYVDENGIKRFKFITIDSSRYIHNAETKNYSYTKIYKIHTLTNEGVYCVIECLANDYGSIDIFSPRAQNGILSITYPTWTSELDFIPFVPVNKLDNTIKFGPSIIQDLIDLSLQNFRLEANLCWLEANAAASHLVVKGKNLEDIRNYPIGAGAVHLLNDDTAQEYYVTPSTAGMDEIRQHIQENTSLANELMYNLTNVAANSSGEALKIRISSKMQDLIGLLKNIGNAITLSLEQIDRIVNSAINKDVIEFVPYLGFADVETIFNGNTKAGEENIQEEKPVENPDWDELEIDGETE